MTESDFVAIERSLGITVPAAYRRIMSAYPFHDDRPSEAFIPDNADYVCSLNQQIRADAVYPNCWRAELLAVGTTWSGDAHVLDTSLADSPVFEFSQEDQTVTTLAESLEEWVSQLSRWYVDFDGDLAAEEYKGITSAVQAAGYFCMRPEPMNGWHRICVCSRPGGGNSFWIMVNSGGWFAGAWGGAIYRIPDKVADFCIAWLTEAPNGTRSDFSHTIQAQYGLQSVSDAEFEVLIRGS